MPMEASRGGAHFGRWLATHEFAFRPAYSEGDRKWMPVGKAPCRGLEVWVDDDQAHLLPFQQLGDRLVLFYWNWRDLNRAEFAALPALLAAVVLAVRRRDSVLVRACVAFALSVLTVSLVSPQPVAMTSFADVRYLVGVIPLGIWITVRMLTFARQPLVALLTP